MCCFTGDSLKNHVDKWLNIKADPEIIKWISEGVTIPFKNNEPQPFEFKNRQFNAIETKFIRSEIQKLVDSKCIKKCTKRPIGVSPISVVPKKKDFRLIIDLRHINTFCAKKSVIYEDIKTVIQVLEPKDYMITTDIKNGFHHIGIHKSHQDYLGFQFENQYYVWLVLPFGACFSPYFFSKTLRPIVSYLRQHDIKTVCYVDDFILAGSESLIATKKDFMLKLLVELGLTINVEKSNLVPSQTQTFIGYIIDTNKRHNKIFIQIPSP